MQDRGIVSFPEEQDRTVPRSVGQEECVVPRNAGQERTMPRGAEQTDRAVPTCPDPQVAPFHLRNPPHPIPSLVTIASGTAPSRFPSPPVDADPCPASSRLVRPPPPIRRIPPARGQRAQQRWQRWPLIPGHASPGGTVAVTHSLIGDQCPRRTIRDKAEPPGANAGLHGCLVRHSAGLMNCPSILSAPLARAGLI